ncbi:MAG TPA: NAD(P)/FAD-dependent oxidoreductase [Planctomycetaceae bacterium]|jgi:NADH dehydrogenase|nr:NAD(P)/FAD-dependent oxidoreductase [Planctomycetaceae bacterium]
MPSTQTANSAAKRSRVVIVGGGFGGLRAAQSLKSAPVDVTLIDRRNYHLFQPLLYQVATGALSPGQVAAPLRSVLSRQKNTRVLLGEVVDLDPVAKRLRLADGAHFDYDSLIVAAGCQSAYYGHDAWSEWAPSLKSLEEATDIRHKILYAFEVAERLTDPTERRAWLRFVIVGGGATGVELSGAIGEISRQTLKNDFRSIRPEEAEIILIDGGSRVLTSFPEGLAEKAVRSLEKLGVQVKTGVMVRQIDKQGVTFESHQGSGQIDTRTVIWAGGITASPFGRLVANRTGAVTDKAGRIQVNPDLTVPNFPDIFVIGDLAQAPGADGKPLPGVAQVAMQQGNYAARSLVRKIRGASPLPPFKYFNKGELAVIGRAAAVANIFGLHISGLFAWLVWALVHLMYLVQFQSRMVVLVQWAIEDLTFSRGARLITGSAATDFNFNQAVAAEAKGNVTSPDAPATRPESKPQQ